MSSADLAVLATTLGLYVAIVLSPGPNFALVSRLAASGAREAALGSSVGFAVAATIYALVTMAGFAVILNELGWLARGVQIVGGVYLVWLGIGSWRRSKAHQAAPQEGEDLLTGLQGVRLGTLVSFSNPKGIAFFIGLFAAAIPPGTALWAKIVIIVGVFTIELLWYGAVALLLSTSGPRAMYQRFRRSIERALGVMLIFFGVRLVVEK
jgi:threonine/homoserine/homoserine lactone efflux protein